VKQRVVALSSCKAEYIAATIGACQGVWLAWLLADMTDKCTNAQGGQQVCLSLIKNHVHHDRSKHIDVRFHLMREYANRGQIEVDFIRTEEQLGDVLTKPLVKSKFRELYVKIDLKNF
jgi:hypothetical protein